MKQGYSVQEAIDKVGDMLDECYRSWHEAEAALPSWGEKIDAQVKKVLELYWRMPMGALNWRYVLHITFPWPGY